jgi:hypothetical protein
MSFETDKCKTQAITYGNREALGFELSQGGYIDLMDGDKSYKYLGMQQSRGIEHKHIKNTLKKTFIKRVDALLKTQLNGKNIINAINTYAIPLLIYSFGVIKWAQMDLTNIQTKINMLLTKHHMHHPKSATERLTLSRKEGGRGLTTLTTLTTYTINK